MSEWVESLLAAIGGGSVVLIGVFTIFKGFLIRFFEIRIESSFEKNLEKFKNSLERSSKAYEILLNREMCFYEKLEPITAELIPLEHDLLYYLQYDEEANHTEQCEKFKELFGRYCELTKKLKNETLIHQSYIPLDVFNAYISVVQQMQDDMTLWFNMAQFLFGNEYSKIDYEKCEAAIHTFLLRLSFAETMVRTRLNQLSGEN